MFKKTAFMTRPASRHDRTPGATYSLSRVTVQLSHTSILTDTLDYKTNEAVRMLDFSNCHDVRLSDVRLSAVNVSDVRISDIRLSGVGAVISHAVRCQAVRCPAVRCQVVICQAVRWLPDDRLS